MNALACTGDTGRRQRATPGEHQVSSAVAVMGNIQWIMVEMLYVVMHVMVGVGVSR